MELILESKITLVESNPFMNVVQWIKDQLTKVITFIKDMFNVNKFKQRIRELEANVNTITTISNSRMNDLKNKKDDLEVKLNSLKGKDKVNQEIIDSLKSKIEVLNDKINDLMTKVGSQDKELANIKGKLIEVNDLSNFSSKIKHFNSYTRSCISAINNPDSVDKLDKMVDEAKQLANNEFSGFDNKISIKEVDLMNYRKTWFNRISKQMEAILSDVGDLSKKLTFEVKRCRRLEKELRANPNLPPEKIRELESLRKIVLPMIQLTNITKKVESSVFKVLANV